jgi:hypothetical protein
MLLLSLVGLDGTASDSTRLKTVSYIDNGWHTTKIGIPATCVEFGSVYRVLDFSISETSVTKCSENMFYNGDLVLRMIKPFPN